MPNRIAISKSVCFLSFFSYIGVLTVSSFSATNLPCIWSSVKGGGLGETVLCLVQLAGEILSGPVSVSLSGVHL